MRRFAGAVVLGAALTACSTGSKVTPPEPTHLADASVAIALQADGAARMSLTLSRFDPVTTPALVDRVARVTFPDADTVTVDEGQSWGRTVGFEVEDAFEPGMPASLRFRGEELFTAFREGGYATGDLTVCWPDVPTELGAAMRVTAIDDCVRWWGVDVGDRIPTIDVVWHPEPWRWVVAFAAVVLVVVTGTAGLWRARRWRAARHGFPAGIVIGTTVAGILGCVALAVGGAEGATTNVLLAGKTGDIGGAVAFVTAFLSTAAVLLFTLCLGVSIHAASTWAQVRQLARSVPARVDLPVGPVPPSS